MGMTKLLSRLKGKATGGEIVTISIVVPVHDPRGEYLAYLGKLVESLNRQSVLPDELVLTASHDISYLQHVIRSVQGKYPVRFFENQSSGAAENTNFAVQKADSQIVKIMFQDDFLESDTVIAACLGISAIRPWFVFPWQHVNQDGAWLKEPKVDQFFSRDLVRGINSIGAPSVVAFLKSAFVEMDESLSYTFDCDWYLAMESQNGPPIFEAHSKISIRRHPGQATHWAKADLAKELLYLQKKYSGSTRFSLKSLWQRIW